MDNKNSPAFPIISSDGFPSILNVIMQDKEPTAIGLTKREYFAAKAMQGLLSIYDADGRNELVPNIINVSYMAELSVKAADELLKQLEQ